MLPSFDEKLQDKIRTHLSKFTTNSKNLENK